MQNKQRHLEKVVETLAENAGMANRHADVYRKRAAYCHYSSHSKPRTAAVVYYTSKVGTHTLTPPR